MLLQYAQRKLGELKNFFKKKVSVNDIFDKYAKSLGDDYLIDYKTEDVANDLEIFEHLSTDNQYAIKITKNRNYPDIWQFKLIKYGDPVSLSRGLPIIENFGFKLLDEHSYKIELDKARIIYICDFGVRPINEELTQKLEDKNLLAYLEEAIIAVFDRNAESDLLNKLVLLGGLTVRQVGMMRAITHYIIQSALPFSKAYLVDCLTTYPKIASKLYQLFSKKFDPKFYDNSLAQSLCEEVILELNEVKSLDHDSILRAYLAVTEAMIRTNFFQVNDNNKPKSYISFKLDSSRMPFLPKPLPLYEIFVYSIRFEGIHLRGGKVARGGLRWSDRLEDFRTEVLGLVKAQMVKNSVIVPNGSKGGFVCKKLPSVMNREEYIAEGINCYKNFICGLLDITDNIVSGNVIPPKNVVRHDGDDPYLVVAADKGTATFSDYANEISIKYNFWLGDAFASGGSAGYDHKKMGITARGAWESAKRHFRHLGVNIQNEDFTVIGIGDMSGDVFGNGMLLSKHIKLIAAFNHQHIFLDPNPDIQVSFVERERLFRLPRSTWADYNPNKISKGGGVYDRSLKSITLTEEIRNWLEVSVNAMTPNELINHILKAKADMLYNGGIGTYIKAKSETNDMVKDKANDLIRVNGEDLQVKVVIEGGNLGVTQLGRIEFAKKDGWIYTDAIDNCAGVNCSDHEVNIKILLADVMNKSGMDLAKRNQILSNMTDEVATLVLKDNYLQTEMIRYSSARSSDLLSVNMNFIDKLEKGNELNRELEFLPTNEEALVRQKLGTGLTQPELSVLLSYAKICLKREIVVSDIVLGHLFEELLIEYFPKYLQDNYLENIKEHYLRKEIIANQLANLVVNRVGITFVSRFEDEFSTSSTNVLYAFWAIYKMMDATAIFDKVSALDNKISAGLQIEMLIRIKKALERLIRLALRRVKGTKIEHHDIIKYKSDIARLMLVLPKILKNADYANVNAYEKYLTENGVSYELAVIVARTNYIPQLLDIVIIAHETGFTHNIESIAHNYFYVGRKLKLDWLRRSLINLPSNNKWQALARSALLAECYNLYALLTKSALQSAKPEDEKFVETWMINKEPQKIALINEIFSELEGQKEFDLAMLSAVTYELNRIIA